ncbi:unnamed protein product [Adineta steineri]|uniref:MAM domain-containing protein n=1 Tax=Adineta steineri TaxID=433720 RepID=A0A818YGU6_9BILA|nr:unnamed protein product [Adineta steineri]CAF1059231.1 unnamed protein product [Adineta steineri]CAF1124972.1 unnamed protein product [Adineta steineri]CAF3748337.1 unnamed protein product [Adineta steineri]CAF3750730.1 unnamed protein product [Adineta steineri]
MCEMQNGVWFDPTPPLYNFSIATGQNVPDKELAPTVDHTYNSSSGHFAYWHRPSHALHTDVDGRLSIPIFELTKHMCLNFAYYVKSSESTRNTTFLAVAIKGCYTATLWVMHADDTQGWNTAEIQLLDLTCNVTIRFDVWPDIFNAVSVALDDIVIDICPRYETTTTSISTGHSPRLRISEFSLQIFDYFLDDSELNISFS